MTIESVNFWQMRLIKGRGEVGMNLVLWWCVGGGVVVVGDGRWGLLWWCVLWRYVGGG